MKRLLVFLTGVLLVASPLRAAAGDDDPRLGIMVMSLTKELRQHFGAAPDRGVLVARVMPGSPAAAAGLAVGDVVTDVSGKPVDDAADVTAALAGAKKGDTVPVRIVRDRKPLSVTATIGAFDATSFLMRFAPWMQPFREILADPETRTATRPDQSKP